MWQVRRKEVTGGGMVCAISRISASLITPGPLGMSPTKPKADAPYFTAVCASCTLLMQQILILGVLIYLQSI